MSKEVMKLALEAMGLIGADLVCEAAHHERADRHGVGEPCPIQARWHHAFAALREALANEALERMAENARELGLDYDTPAGTQVSKVWWDGEKLMEKHIPFEEFYKPVQQDPVALLQEIARLHDRIKDLTLDVEFLSQPAQQEPVGDITCWTVKGNLKNREFDYYGNLPDGTHLLYTSPPAQRPWVGLVWGELPEDGHNHDFLRGAVWAEAKLKDKNT